MKTMKLAAAILTLAITGTVAEAACNQSHINNKTWKLTAHLDATLTAPAALISCTFKTKGNGAVDVTADGCDVTAIPSADFASPTKYNIETGSQIVATPGQKCSFDATINLKTGDTTSIMLARLVMESGKTIAAGNFLMGDSGGTVAVLRQ